MIHHLACEIGLLRPDDSTIGVQFEQRSPSPISGTEEDLVVAKDRGRTVGRAVGRPVVAKHQLAISRPNPDRRRRCKVENRPDTPNIDQNWRGVGRLITQILCHPDPRAGHLVERNHSRTLTTRRDYHPLTIDQR